MENNNRHGNAIASLVCGIISLFFARIIFGIIAVLEGDKALEVIKAGEPDYNIAMVGKILGWISIIITIIAVIVGVSLIMVGVASAE